MKVEKEKCCGNCDWFSDVGGAISGYCNWVERNLPSVMLEKMSFPIYTKRNKGTICQVYKPSTDKEGV